MKLKQNHLLSAIFTSFYLLWALAFLSSGILQDPYSLQLLNIVPEDSIGYISRGLELNKEEFNLIDIIGGALNWFSLSYIYSIFGSYASAAYILLNSILVFFYFQLSLEISKNTIRGTSLKFCILLALSSPYLLAWILVPNKEIIYSVGVLAAINFIIKKERKKIFSTAFIVGLFKIQFLLSYLMYYTFKWIRRRIFLTLIAISLIYPVAVGVLPGLSMSIFLEGQENEINTAATFLMLESIGTTYFGFFIAGPAKLAINMLAGIDPSRALDSPTFLASVAPLTSFAMSILCIISGLFFLKRKKSFSEMKEACRSDAAFFIYCLIIINVLVPFLQPRYYWWTIPLLLTYILSAGHLIRK